MHRLPVHLAHDHGRAPRDRRADGDADRRAEKPGALRRARVAPHVSATPGTASRTFERRLGVSAVGCFAVWGRCSGHLALLRAYERAQGRVRASRRRSRGSRWRACSRRRSGTNGRPPVTRRRATATARTCASCSQACSRWRRRHPWQQQDQEEEEEELSPDRVRSILIPLAHEQWRLGGRGPAQQQHAS